MFYEFLCLIVVSIIDIYRSISNDCFMFNDYKCLIIVLVIDI